MSAQVYAIMRLVNSVRGARAAAVFVAVVFVFAAIFVGALLMHDAAAYRTPSGLGRHRTEFQTGLILVLVGSAAFFSGVAWWQRLRRR